MRTHTVHTIHSGDIRTASDNLVAEDRCRRGRPRVHAESALNGTSIDIWQEHHDSANYSQGVRTAHARRPMRPHPVHTSGVGKMLVRVTTRIHILSIARYSDQNGPFFSGRCWVVADLRPQKTCSAMPPAPRPCTSAGVHLFHCPTPIFWGTPTQNGPCTPSLQPNLEVGIMQARDCALSTCGSGDGSLPELVEAEP